MHETQTTKSLMFLPHFDAFFDLSITEQTHCNMESVCFIEWSEKKRQTNASYRLTVRGFVDVSALACVASVSSRGSSRKLGQSQKKKKMNDGGGGGEWRYL